MGFLGGLFGKGDKVMYYPGCYTKTFLPEILENYKKILTDLEIEFIMAEEVTCCGMPLKEAGHSEEFEDNMDKLKKQIKRDNVRKIITNCPECAKILKENLNIETEHITKTLLFNKYKINTDNKGTVSYHKHLDSDEKTEKELLQEIGHQIQKTQRDCCGSRTAFKINNPEIADEIAKRSIQQAGNNTIITTSPKCYDHLKKNSQGVEVMELSQTAKNSIKKTEPKNEPENS